jgi:hypothetical protein
MFHYTFQASQALPMLAASFTLDKLHTNNDQNKCIKHAKARLSMEENWYDTLNIIIVIRFKYTSIQTPRQRHPILFLFPSPTSTAITTPMIMDTIRENHKCLINGLTHLFTLFIKAHYIASADVL